MADGRTQTSQGAGRVLGAPGVYHHASEHDFAPSTHYGFGSVVTSLCGRTTGIVYSEDALGNLYPDDRLCKWCARRTAE